MVLVAYLILLLVVIVLQPDAAMVTVYLSLIVTTVMIVSVLAYTKNSLYEKGLNAAKEMAKIKFSWKHKGAEMVTPDNIIDEEGEEDG